MRDHEVQCKDKQLALEWSGADKHWLSGGIKTLLTTAGSSVSWAQLNFLSSTMATCYLSCHLAVFGKTFVFKKKPMIASKVLRKSRRANMRKHKQLSKRDGWKKKKKKKIFCFHQIKASVIGKMLHGAATHLEKTEAWPSGAARHHEQSPRLLEPHQQGPGRARSDQSHLPQVWVDNTGTATRAVCI